ncbi:transcriptional regulator [Deinococcus misasensis]|uniref:transcriptional regulator n=1 Tax=Deinococcus misasensis TaxID=392413 RepID=UPI000557502A|nr:transcriptional regulator [Deinococcus misasensis]
MTHDDLEQQLAEQLKTRMAQQGHTQESLGLAIDPAAKQPRQNIHQYLSGSRSLLVGTTLKILKALGAKRIHIEWKD